MFDIFDTTPAPATIIDVHVPLVMLTSGKGIFFGCKDLTTSPSRFYNLIK